MASGASPQTVHYPFGAGVDEHTYVRHLQAPRLRRCENGRFTRAGTISKRPGNTLIATSAAGSPTKLVAVDNELLALMGTSAVSYSERNAALMPLTGTHEAVPSITNIAAGYGQAEAADYAVGSGLEVYTWSDATSIASSGTVRSTVRDLTSGTLLQAAATVYSGYIFPRLVVIGTTVISVAAEAFAANIAARVLSADGTQWGAPANIVGDNQNGGEFDIATDGTNLFVVYRDTSNKVHVRSFTAALAAVASKQSAETNIPQAMGVTATAGERVWVSYTYLSAGTWHLRAAAFSTNLATETVAPFDVWTSATEQPTATSPLRVTSTTACILTNINGDGPSYAVVAPVVNTSGSVVAQATGAHRRTYWAQAACKPFKQGSLYYVWAYVGGARFSNPSPPTQQLLQYSLVLCDIQAHDTGSTNLQMRPVCTEAPRFAYQQSVTVLTGQQVHLSGSYSPATNKWQAAGLVLRSNNGRVGIVGVTADFAHPNRGQSACNGGNTHMTPGTTYDGQSLSEISFCFWPQELTVSGYAGAGGLVNGTRYRWRAVYIWPDARGQLQRSAPSDYVESTASNSTATLLVPALTIASSVSPYKAAGVAVELYRTTGNPDDSTAYYLVSTTANVPTAATLSIADGATDATIGKNAQIYTTTGALRRVQPPGFSSLVAYRGRLWGAHGNQLWYSGAFVDGEAPWFADAFMQPIDSAENITALWVMDETLYVSTATKLYFLQADGPADNGSQNDVGVPSRIAADLGCIEPRSVVVTPIGTLYQTAVGIQLLTRKRSTPEALFGLRVESTLATYPTIVAAVVHPSAHYVLFFCTNGATSARIVYDYAADEWAVDTSAIFGVLVSAVVKGSAVWWMNTTATASIYKESSDCLDAVAWVTRVVEGADFNPTGISGNMKLLKTRLQADRKTSHGLTLDFAKDYDSAYFDTRSFSDAEVDALTPIEEIDVTPKAQRCQAMRIRITDSAPTVGALGTGAGCDLVALSYDFDPLENQFQLPATARK